MEVMVLYLDFTNEEGKKVTYSIEDPRYDVLPEEVGATMDLMISKDIFEPKLIEKVGARFVTRTEEEIL